MAPIARAMRFLLAAFTIMFLAACLYRTAQGLGGVKRCASRPSGVNQLSEVNQVTRRDPDLSVSRAISADRGQCCDGGKCGVARLRLDALLALFGPFEFG